MTKAIKDKLEYLRGEIEAERISTGEIAELQSLAKYIDKGDTLLLEWAGVPEFSETYELQCKYCGGTQNWTLQESMDINADVEDIDDVLKYDQSVMCTRCGCDMRINESLPDEVLKAHGYLL